MKSLATLALLLLVSRPTVADGLADNDPKRVRPIPPVGIEVPATERIRLESKLTDLEQRIFQLMLLSDEHRHWIPDVEIFHKAVRDALKYREIFHERELAYADELLDEGLRRAAELKENKKPWTRRTGLVVRGFRSEIDGSIQPYGLVIPESYSFEGVQRYRLDIWFHGRGERMMELGFIQQRRQRRGTFAPDDTIVLHPYGRYSNAFKFAGEIDVLEALAATERDYRVDQERISVRGFSMGGAACWQFAVHYADRWFAANPGAGFSETPKFLDYFQKERLRPTWYEKKLWRMYDCNLWAENLVHCPTVAYSGELDIQKQAADVMEDALEQLGIDLVHVVGPKTKHSYHATSAAIVDAKLANLARRGRERTPDKVHLTTYTLRYPTMHWVTIESLEQHWEKATVEATITSDSSLDLATANVSRLKLEMPPGESPFALRRSVQIDVDGQKLEASSSRSDRSWSLVLQREGEAWTTKVRERKGLQKRHGLQGPIDDAFMSSFVFVRPTGKSPNAKLASWANSELERARFEWRRQFRGTAPVMNDVEITDKEIAKRNLVLWGDPSSNAIIGRIASHLPIRWTDDQILLGDVSFDAAEHGLILIFPNPLNQERYIVLNSGFTYREYAYLNNARQVPKLPDWAVIDLRTKPDALWPGKVVLADFFTESWQLRQSK